MMSCGGGVVEGGGMSELQGWGGPRNSSRGGSGSPKRQVRRNFQTGKQQKKL